jgi:protein-S-isoprenylcysteine O-methyltransferase Ste14
MQDNGKDGAAVAIAPPLFYLGAVLVGVIVHEFVLRLDLGLSAAARIGAGAVAAFLGLALVIGAIGLFRRTGQDPRPWESTPAIVSTGVYRLTRNPMYLGMTLLQAAIGIALANGWIIILVPVALAFVHALVVRHEEAYLEHKFGDEYMRYKASVRRWI